MKLGAERDLEEAVDDFGVGEGLAFGGAALGDLGVFGGGEAGGEDGHAGDASSASERSARGVCKA